MDVPLVDEVLPIFVEIELLKRLPNILVLEELDFIDEEPRLELFRLNWPQAGTSKRANVTTLTASKELRMVLAPIMPLILIIVHPTAIPPGLLPPRVFRSISPEQADDGLRKKEGGRRGAIFENLLGELAKFADHNG